MKAKSRPVHVGREQIKEAREIVKAVKAALRLHRKFSELPDLQRIAIRGLIEAEIIDDPSRAAFAREEANAAINELRRKPSTLRMRHRTVFALRLGKQGRA